MNDLDVLRGLDFEVEESTAIPCAGYMRKVRATGEITEWNLKCKTPPIMIVTRTCCGQQSHLCLECYNWNCRFYANSDGGSGKYHLVCGTMIEGRPFLDAVEWL